MSSLKSKMKDLKDSLDYWKHKYQRVVKFIHDKIRGIFGDKEDYIKPTFLFSTVSIFLY